MADIHKAGMVTCLNTILELSQSSNMVVSYGFEEFKLHRAIIYPHSKFLATACNGQYQEGHTGVIMLMEDDPPTIRRMLTYLYTLDYDDDGEPADIAQYTLNPSQSVDAMDAPTLESQLSQIEAARHARLINNIAVYAVAEKYDIP